MDIEKRFDTNMTISYDNNETYRSVLRRLFYMDISMCPLTMESIDEETRDELMYDQGTVEKVMDELFVLTKENAFFQKLSSTILFQNY